MRQLLPESRNITTVHAYLRARYYDPATAQFLTRDPMVALTLSPYGYVAGDPLNMVDPTGMWGLPLWVKPVAGAVGNAVHTAVAVAVDVIATAPYAIYAGAYTAAHAANHIGCNATAMTQTFSCGLTHVLALPLVPLEAIGQGGDLAIDKLKGESRWDEGRTIHLGPAHSYAPSWISDPTIQNAPGVHSSGHVDFEW